MASVGSRPQGTADVRAAGRTAVVAGGACWAVGVIQYVVAQVVAAAAWTVPYSLRNDYVSDLGNTACGMFRVPPGTPHYVCSPDHGLANASFVILGVLTIAGALALRQIWPSRHLARWALALWILSGLGKIIVGLNPENTRLGLHLLGALNVPLGSVAILLLSLAIRRASQTLSIAGIALAVAGLAGTVLFIGGQYAGSSLYLGSASVAPSGWAATPATCGC